MSIIFFLKTFLIIVSAQTILLAYSDIFGEFLVALWLRLRTNKDTFIIIKSYNA